MRGGALAGGGAAVSLCLWCVLQGPGCARHEPARHQPGGISRHGEARLGAGQPDAAWQPCVAVAGLPACRLAVAPKAQCVFCRSNLGWPWLLSAAGWHEAQGVVLMQTSALRCLRAAAQSSGGTERDGDQWCVPGPAANLDRRDSVRLSGAGKRSTSGRGAAWLTADSELLRPAAA